MVNNPFTPSTDPPALQFPGPLNPPRQIWHVGDEISGVQEQ